MKDEIKNPSTNPPFKKKYLYIYHRLYIDKAPVNLNNSEGNYSEHKKAFKWVGDELFESPAVSTEVIKRAYVMAMVYNNEDKPSMVKTTLRVPDAISLFNNKHSKKEKKEDVLKDVIENDFILDINGFLLPDSQASKDAVIMPTIATAPILHLEDDILTLGQIDKNEISLSLGSDQPHPYHIERVNGAIEFETVVKLNYISWAGKYYNEKEEIQDRLKILCKSAVSEDFLIHFGKNRANPRYHIIALTTKRIYIDGVDPLIVTYNYLKNESDIKGVIFLNPEFVDKMDRLYPHLKHKPNNKNIDNYTALINHINENYSDRVKVIITTDHDEMMEETEAFLTTHIMK